MLALLFFFAPISFAEEPVASRLVAPQPRAYLGSDGKCHLKVKYSETATVGTTVADIVRIAKLPGGIADLKPIFPWLTSDSRDKLENKNKDQMLGQLPIEVDKANDPDCANLKKIANKLKESYEKDKYKVKPADIIVAAFTAEVYVPDEQDPPKSNPIIPPPKSNPSSVR